MNAHPILLQMKYARIIEELSKQLNISLNQALDFFYRSENYQLIYGGVADMHCMSDGYLVEELKMEYKNIK